MMGLRLGFVEPHLGRYGGIRRMVEFGNRLVARGHEVVFLLPEGEVLGCSWMRCDAEVRPLGVGVGERWDVVLFNHEPQWFLLERFGGARKRVFYALHDGCLYGKEGSFEARFAGVDVQLANSSWTADRLEADTGVRPLVVLGGVNREVFRPYGGVKRFEVLCSGLSKWWKGTDVVREAGRLAGVGVEGYAGLDLSQEDLGRAYDAARVFAVGSLFEGFCQPGLEALACGVPLVTSDCGGCREYAIDGETALVVPPGDPGAMAGAIRRVLDEPGLGAGLVERGLDLVAERFDWERATDRFAEILDGVVASVVSAPPPARPQAPQEPDLSVVVLAWDNLLLTQRCVESIRRNTTVGYELVIVDNGSAADAADYARLAADTAVLNDTNLGFAAGMNQGLAASKGEWIAFCNNDIKMPPGWADKLLETARSHPRAGIIVPALTEARDPTTVRSAPGEQVEVLPPFSAPPPAVVYLMRADIARAIGGWDETYKIASGEDVDLAFTIWVNDLDIIYDSRVLVEHIGKASASRLDDWQTLWAQNRRRFLDKWTSQTPIPRIHTCDPQRHHRNRTIAQSTAQWMHKYFTARDRLAAKKTKSVPEREVRPASEPSKPRPPEPAQQTEPEPVAHRWLRELERTRGGHPVELIRGPDGTVYVREGDRRRRVSSGLLAAALEEELGAASDVSDAQVARLTEGVPIEVLLSREVGPSVIVGGRRLPVWGLPIPRTVTVAEAERYEEGPELDVAGAHLPAYLVERQIGRGPGTRGSVGVPRRVRRFL